MRSVARMLVIALAATAMSPDVSAAVADSRPGTMAAQSDPRLKAETMPLTPEPRWNAATDVDRRGAAPYAVTPPRPGTVTVALPAGGMSRVGDLPVLVGRASGAAPARVTVTVHDSARAVAAGASFVLLSVERADGGRAPARVRLAVDYSGFRDAFGGDYATRLRLMALGSTQPVVVSARNDLSMGQLVADVDVPPATVIDDGLGRTEPDTAAARLTGRTPTSDTAAQVGPSPTLDPSPSASAEPTSSGSAPEESLPDLLTGDSGTYALASTPTGPTGDYTATPLSSSAKWGVSKNTGGFSWTYPFPMPPAPAGKTPSLELSYSSQSVDGRTAKANGQVSQVGEGFTFSPMFIERKFQSCTDDGQTAQDLCHQRPEYFLSWNGRASELVRNGATNHWRLRDDPGWRIRSFQGAVNGDQFGDYWEVTTPDGTQHLFGYGKEPVTNADTFGAWTVPVFGDDIGEPCYSATGFATSHCKRAWRWNLDRIIDPNDNVVSLFWTKETNYYAKNGGTPALYDRGGYLRRVDYGERNTRENWTAPAYVTVTTTHRCLAQVGCTDATLNDPGNYPDVPLDLRCTSATSCPGLGQKAPSFWSTEKVVKVNTWVKNNDATDGSATYSDVDEVELFYSFPDPGDGTSEALFLTTIRRHGLVGTRITLPDVHLGGTALANRVDYDIAGGVPPTNKFRVTAIENELGLTTNITYGHQNACSAAALPPNGGWHQNNTDCFPQYFDPDGPGGTAAGWGAFRKYLVLAVEADDTTVPVAHSPNNRVSYTYLGAPAWHYDNQLQGSEGPAGTQSWADYRGYESVREVAGDAASTSRATTVYKAFRGMHADKAAPTGGSKSVSLQDYENTSFTDSDWLAGHPLETIRYSVSGAALERVFHGYWAVQEFAGPDAWQDHHVYYVRESTTSAYTRNTVPSVDTWRRRRVDTTYDSTYAVPQSVLDMGDTAVLTDDTCTVPMYTHNATSWLVGLPYVARRYAGNCASPTQIGRTETMYDGQGYMAAPTSGNVTTVKALIDGAAAAVTTTSYDLLGRVASVMSPNDYVKLAAQQETKTTYTYNPASGYPRLGVTTRQGVGNGSTGRITTTTVPDIAWGLPRLVTDVSNGNLTTQINHDALGRTVSVQRPEDPAGVPGLRFEYHVSQDVPTRVLSQQLLEGTTSLNAVYVDKHAYVTSFGTPAQTQTRAPGGGRIITSTRYDDQGRTVGAAGPMTRPNTPGADFVNYDPATAASDTRTAYDALGRTAATRLYGTNVLKATTTYDHGGWSTIAHPPVRAQVTTHFDVFGRTTTINETTPDATDGYSTTTFTYTRTGLHDTIVDDNGNDWDYGYDWLGRRTSASDPDQGTWTTTYDANGNVTTVTDAVVEGGTPHVIWNGYDELNRRTETRQSGPTGTQLATWTYGTSAGFVGRLVSASTTTPTGNFTYAITGYDGRGRVTGKSWTIPGAEGALAGTYTYGYTYDHADDIRTTVMPAGGGLPAETITAGFDADGRPSTLTGTTTYVGGTTYDGVGRLLTRQLGSTGVTVARQFGHDPATGLLTSATATVAGSSTGTNGVQDELSLQYDEAGNVARVGALQPGVTPLTQYECFDYNWRNQLERAFTTTGGTCSTPDSNGASPYDYTYAYDTTSNLKSVVGTDTNGAVNRQFGYPTPGAASINPHALDTIGGVDKFDYDANGATTRRYDATGTQQNLTWNWLHQLERLRTGTSSDTTFVYDADGKRLLRRDPSGTRTLFLEGQELTATGSTVTATRYYGSHAIRATSGTAPGLYWLVTNHQGSPTVSVNASTGAVVRRRYGPYGESRTGGAGSLATPRGFLNQIDDPTGLVATDARYLDTTTGQFISSDPVLVSGDARSLNPFLYSYGNPTSLIDPSGLAPITEEGGDVTECSTGPGICDDNEVRHLKYQDVLAHTAVGMPTSDHVVAGVVFTDQQKEQMKWAYLTSPCFGEDASGCFGNRRVVFACQVNGNVNCDEWADEVAERGAGAAEFLTFALNVTAASRLSGGSFLKNSGREDGVNIGTARFAQKTFGEKFGKDGLFRGRTIDDVAGDLRSGALQPKNVPIRVIVRDGNTLILNTRSAQALTRAGIPRDAWYVINSTGDSLFEALLSGQLSRNGLTNMGFELP